MAEKNKIAVSRQNGGDTLCTIGTASADAGHRMNVYFSVKQSYKNNTLTVVKREDNHDGCTDVYPGFDDEVQHGSCPSLKLEVPIRDPDSVRSRRGCTL